MYQLLIVDDEPLMRRGIKHLVDLDSLKISQVHEASNGLEALSIIEKETVDLILLDINMPKMDGLSFAEKVKDIKPDIIIAMITGYDYFDYAVKALRAGVDDYLLKPVSKKDIDAVLKKMTQKLGQKRIEDAVGKPSDDQLEHAFSLVLEEMVYDSRFSLTTFADRVGFSSGYLSGVFKDIYGVTFQDYVTEKRMEKAKLLLLTSNMKNYEIAEAIGFDDVNYFSTRFKKHFGTTPKKYKQKVISHEI